MTPEEVQTKAQKDSWWNAAANPHLLLPARIQFLWRLWSEHYPATDGITFGRLCANRKIHSDDADLVQSLIEVFQQLSTDEQRGIDPSTNVHSLSELLSYPQPLRHKIWDLAIRLEKTSPPTIDFIRQAAKQLTAPTMPPATHAVLPADTTKAIQESATTAPKPRAAIAPSSDVDCIFCDWRGPLRVVRRHTKARHKELVAAKGTPIHNKIVACSVKKWACSICGDPLNSYDAFLPHCRVAHPAIPLRASLRVFQETNCPLEDPVMLAKEQAQDVQAIAPERPTPEQQEESRPLPTHEPVEYPPYIVNFCPHCATNLKAVRVDLQHQNLLFCACPKCGCKLRGIEIMLTELPEPKL